MGDGVGVEVGVLVAVGVAVSVGVGDSTVGEAVLITGVDSGASAGPEVSRPGVRAAVERLGNVACGVRLVQATASNATNAAFASQSHALRIQGFISHLSMTYSP